MSEEIRGTLITTEELERHAGYFDEWVNNFEVNSPNALKAKQNFLSFSEEIYNKRVKDNYRTISVEDFRAHLRSRCRSWLKSNRQ